MQNYQLTFSWRINGTIKLLHRYTPVMNSRVTTPGLPAADFKYADLIEQLIQERNRAEAGRVRAEQSNLAKSKFFAAASHDLRQPLLSLRLFAKTLKSKVVDNEHRELALNIQRSVQALLELSDELLDLSRLDSTTMTATLRDVNLRSVLNSLYSGFRLQADQKDIDLVLNCPELFVSTDQVLLERVLNNIISNAIHYTDAGSVTVSAELHDDTVVLQVTDTGCGIPHEMHESVFSEFVQLDNPERDRSKGHGLGLSIVRRITDLLGIDVDLDSSPGQGTTFTLTLQQSNKDLTPVSTEATGLEALFVCVIDPDEKNRQTMKSQLESSGCIVLVASCTSECERLLKDYEYDPDVIIEDSRLRGRKTQVR